MPKFDIFLKNKKIKVQKNTTESPSEMVGFDYVGSLMSSTKIVALKQATEKVKSGFFESKVKKTSTLIVEKKSEFADPSVDEVKKAIYCDVNGVLDDDVLVATADIFESATFYVPSIVCPNKAFKLLKLAIDNKADLVLISEWRLSGLDFFTILAKSVGDVEEYVDYFDDNIDEIMHLTGGLVTDDIGDRTVEVRKHIVENKYTHFVVFEDYHYIEEELNPIMVDSMVRLTDSNINTAREILLK